MKALTDQEKKVLDGYLEDDSGRGDLTDIIFDGETSTGEIVAEADCVLSGVEAIEYVFGRLGCTITHAEGSSSGSLVGKGAAILKVSGPAKGIMRGERIALNILSRMSAIATLSRSASDSAESISPGTRVAGTRKTTPGFALFEKRALMDGGALPHRMDLSTLAMLKDNHIKVLGGGPDAVMVGVQMIRDRYGPYVLVEVEVEDIPCGLAAVEAGADIIMLDNFTVESIAVASTEIIKAAEEQGREVILEASGGISLNDIPGFAPHVDVISMGELTYDAPFTGFNLIVP
ncbi:MAG: carboxylating nicotinate-nucleotide diphosphorylase [Thermoplasmatota archaeon]